MGAYPPSRCGISYTCIQIATVEQQLIKLEYKHTLSVYPHSTSTLSHE